tara:strand:- start:116 stop:361 length:246 start_codon:yes stop_codon:yes gene_type:complete
MRLIIVANFCFIIALLDCMALIGAMKMKRMEGDGVGRKRTIITGISSNVILYSIGSKERLHWYWIKERLHCYDCEDCDYLG